jgi:hypothetical protein
MGHTFTIRWHFGFKEVARLPFRSMAEFESVLRYLE